MRQTLEDFSVERFIILIERKKKSLTRLHGDVHNKTCILSKYEIMTQKKTSKIDTRPK